MGHRARVLKNYWLNTYAARKHGDEDNSKALRGA